MQLGSGCITATVAFIGSVSVLCVRLFRSLAGVSASSLSLPLANTTTTTAAIRSLSVTFVTLLISAASTSLCSVSSFSALGASPSPTSERIRTLIKGIAQKAKLINRITLLEQLSLCLPNLQTDLFLLRKGLHLLVPQTNCRRDFSFFCKRKYKIVLVRGDIKTLTEILVYR
jgi:hypothetical protein